MSTERPESLHVFPKCYTSALCINTLWREKNNTSCFRQTKEGVSCKELDGQRGNPKELIKYSALHVKKLRQTKKWDCMWKGGGQLKRWEAERGDTLQVGTIVRLNWALIQVCTKALKKGQERWTEARSEEGTCKNGS